MASWYPANENPVRTLFTTDALLPGGWAHNVRIDIDGHGNIAEVEPNASPAGCEMTGGPVIPGMPNLHSHAFQRAMAGLAERSGGGSKDSFWTWRNLMYRFVAQITPEDSQAIAAQLYVELLKAGYTTVGEFHYVHHAPGGKPYADIAAMSFAHVSAARDSGIAMTLLPVLYEQGGFGGLPLSAAQARFETSVKDILRIIESLRRHLGVEREVRIGVAPHSLRAVAPESLRRLVEGVTRIDPGMPIHMHVAEQIKEVADCRAWSGLRPLEWLLENTELGPRWCLVHCTHATDVEIWRLAGTGAVVGLCPTTEGNLGDGVFDLPTLLEVEGRLGIGSDSHVSRSPAEELRWLEYGQRLSTHRRNIATTPTHRSTGGALWTQAIKGGAQALGRRCGTLEPGMRADLVVLDGEHVDMVGRVGDTILDAFVFSGGERMVKHVAVSGRWIVRDRTHVREEMIERRYKSTLAALLRIV